jgi:hypothetical protein
MRFLHYGWVASVVLLFSACGAGQSPENPKPAPPSPICSIPQGEQPINFFLQYPADSNRYLYNVAEVDSGVANFFTYFKYQVNQQQQELDTPNQTLRVKDLNDMYTLIKNDPVLGYNAATDYAALRMSFGMTGKRVIIIFEPVVLKPTGEPNFCTITGSTHYFRADDVSSMVALDEESTNEIINGLCSPMSPIYINHPENPEIHSFINSDGPDGDIRSVVMTFQEIFGMYCANATAPSLNDRINFTILANQMTPQGNFKMHTVVNYRIGQKPPATGTFDGDGADFSTTCPSMCQIIPIEKDPFSAH